MIHLFQFLCCLNEDDRNRMVLENTWAYLWQRLGNDGDPPNLDTALIPLVEQALTAAEIDPDTRQLYLRIHPGVADFGRTTVTSEFAAAVDTELGNFWLSNLAHARLHEQPGRLVLPAANSAAPYLLRQRRWIDLAFAADQILFRDDSSATAARLLPMLNVASEATSGTDDELALRGIYARALAILDPQRAEALIASLVNTAIAHEQHTIARNLIADLMNLHKRTGHLNQALALAEAMPHHTHRARLGPWTQLAERVGRLQILYLQGHHQQVLQDVDALRAQLSALPYPPEPNDSTVTPWNVVEALLNTGALAARELGLWRQALDLNAENLQSKSRRGATAAEYARDAFNDYGSLLRLGRPLDARGLLIRCLSGFEHTDDVSSLCVAFSALADVEYHLGHEGSAIELAENSLRFGYLVQDPHAISIAHYNLATYLSRERADPDKSFANLLAAALIAYQTGLGWFSKLLPVIGEQFLIGMARFHLIPRDRRARRSGQWRPPRQPGRPFT